VRIIFWLSPIFVGGFLVYLTRAQFLAWQQHGLSQYLIPPYATIDYFLQYVFLHWWGSYITSFLAGFLFLKLAQYFNKKHGEKFFEKEEPYFIGLSMFLAGHPGWVLYLILILAVTLLFALINWLYTKQLYRIPYYHFWLPLGLAAIVLDQILLRFWPYYQVFVFAR